MIERCRGSSAFYGIVIEMYFGDHPPPHFHARHSGDAVKIDIASGAVIAGSLPGRAVRLVREWIEEHRDELEVNWERAVRYQELQADRTTAMSEIIYIAEVGTLRDMGSGRRSATGR
jgi:hypothetical protein